MCPNYAGNDSLFSRTAGLLNTTRNGLTGNYDALAKKAFHSKYWSDTTYVKVSDAGQVQPATSTTGYRQIELKFPLFFGLALHEYQALLISDLTPFDGGKLTPDQVAGQNLFLGKGKCVSCHSGPLMSNADATQAQGVTPVERLVVGDGGVAL